MSTIVWVALGGALGSVSRYLVAVGMLPFAQRAGVALPVWTLTVNLVGCFFVGLLASVLRARAPVPGPELSVPLALLQVGFLGGFTTFSAFGLETVDLARAGAWPLALSYVLLHLVGGVVLCGAGMALGAVLSQR